MPSSERVHCFFLRSFAAGVDSVRNLLSLRCASDLACRTGPLACDQHWYITQHLYISRLVSVY